MIKCMVVDDEEMAVKVIASYLGKLKGIEVAGSYHSALDAFTALQTEAIDLVFLDIQMPDLDGLSLLRSLSRKPHVILTTAHRDFALESYDLDAIDYLLKPFSFDRFLQAIDKFMLRFHNKAREASYVDRPLSGTTDAPFIYIKTDRQFIRIMLEEIYYLESIKNHVKIFTPKGILITLQTISEMEEKLPPQRFVRVHRSFIVALNKIEQFSYSMVKIHDQTLPIGNTYKDELIKKLTYHGFI